jgi:prevent-host-death family protein
MSEIGVRELKQKMSEIIRKVREERAAYDVTYRGRVVARLVPVDNGRRQEDEDQVWAEIDDLAQEIGRVWPKGATAVDAVREQRREL